MRLHSFRLSLLAFSCVSLAACGALFETELQKAIDAHDATAVARLLASGADRGSSWAELAPPGRLAIASVSASSPDSIEILRLVIAAEPDSPAFLHQTFYVNCKRSPCYAPAAVEHVARQRSVEAVQVMLDAGLDPRSQGVTNALVYAIAEDDEPMARFLVAAGADVNGWASAGGNRYVGPVSVLEAARRKENAALIELLLARGAR